jgi:predicted secreted acid phosphatase
LKDLFIEVDKNPTKSKCVFWQQHGKKQEGKKESLIISEDDPIMMMIGDDYKDFK